MIVRIVYLVYRLVMPIGKNRRLALMIVQTTDSWFMRLFWLEKLRKTFRYRIERVLFLE